MLRPGGAVNQHDSEAMQDHSRLHVEPASPLNAGAEVAMAETQAHYLSHVLRRRPGDWVRLFNARDGEWLACIVSLPRRDAGRFSVTSQLRAPMAQAGPILLFAPVKRDATDLIVRMATELGAGAIWPVLTERTNAARVRTDRLSAIATEAAEQSERLSVPLVREPRSLASLLSEWPGDQLLCAAIERLDGESLGGVVTHRRAAVVGGVLIGPEGGFTRPELDALHAHPFVTPISLGSRILRAETAAAAALACLQSAREHWAFNHDPLPGGGPQVPHPPALPAEPDVQPR